MTVPHRSSILGTENLRKMTVEQSRSSMEVSTPCSLSIRPSSYLEPRFSRCHESPSTTDNKRPLNTGRLAASVVEEPESCFGLAHMNLRHGQVLKTHTGPLPHDVWLFQLLWYDLSQTCAIHFGSNAAPKVLRGLLRHNQRGRLRVQLSSIGWRQ